MSQPKLVFRALYPRLRIGRSISTDPTEPSTSFKRVLILKKRSRYELEKVQRPGISDQQLDSLLTKRGSDLQTLLETHRHHNKVADEIKRLFRNRGFEVVMVDRNDYNEDKIKWADLVVAAGGDGTYLIGASEIKSTDKPIVGFNTDPSKSAGYLCIPAAANYEKVIHRIAKCEFEWRLRTRIAVKLTGPRAHEEPVDLGLGHLVESPGVREPNSAEELNVTSRVLPYLALNEVFIGESLSSQVSSLVMDVPGVQKSVVKCSGLCVSTGTGSTSWHLSINRISTSKVMQIAKLLKVEVPPETLSNVTNLFNESLQFRADDPMLYYTLRDTICSTVSPVPQGLPCGSFVPSLRVTSKCIAANLVLDGSRAWAFNDGTMVELNSKPENMLRTIKVLNLF